MYNYIWRTFVLRKFILIRSTFNSFHIPSWSYRSRSLYLAQDRGKDYVYFTFSRPHFGGIPLDLLLLLLLFESYRSSKNIRNKEDGKTITFLLDGGYLSFIFIFIFFIRCLCEILLSIFTQGPKLLSFYVLFGRVRYEKQIVKDF